MHVRIPLPLAVILLAMPVVMLVSVLLKQDPASPPSAPTSPTTQEKGGEAPDSATTEPEQLESTNEALARIRHWVIREYYVDTSSPDAASAGLRFRMSGHAVIDTREGKITGMLVYDGGGHSMFTGVIVDGKLQLDVKDTFKLHLAPRRSEAGKVIEFEGGEPEYDGDRYWWSLAPG